MSDTLPSLAEAFQQYFELVPATDQALRDEVYRIRFEVYCRDMRFESEDAFPDGREIDEFDAQSRHCLLRHRPSGTFAGCVRMVLNSPGDPSSQLPFERHCKHSIDRERFDPDQLPRDKFGEISRLAVLPRFRRRADEASTPHGIGAQADYFSPAERRVFPHVALGLYIAAAAIAVREGLDMAIVMMEPRLARHMRYFGINFVQAGDVVDYHGLRGPFYITRDSLQRDLDPQVAQLLQGIVHGFNR